MNLTECTKFNDYLVYIRQGKNVVAELTNVLARLHDLPPEDFVNTIGRMGNIWTLANRDTGYLMKIIWNTASDGIAGSHLSYIKAILLKRKEINGYGKSKYTNDRRGIGTVNDDPDKYIKGRYGHCVHR